MKKKKKKKKTMVLETMEIKASYNELTTPQNVPAAPHHLIRIWQHFHCRRRRQTLRLLFRQGLLRRANAVNHLRYRSWTNDNGGHL